MISFSFLFSGKQAVLKNKIIILSQNNNNNTHNNININKSFGDLKITK